MAIAIDTTASYAYANADSTLRYVYGSALVNRGDWALAATYTPSQVVTYASALYLALAGSTGQAPSGNVSVYWSVLVLAEAGAVVDPDDQEIASLASGAFALAVMGSNLASDAYAIAVDGTNLAQLAYDIAVAGGGTQGLAAFAAAEAAYALAAIGTNVGTNAYSLAQSAFSGANGAFNLAVAGTNLAQTAFTIATNGSVNPNGNNYRFQNGWFSLLNLTDSLYHPVYMYGAGTEATLAWGSGTL